MAKPLLNVPNGNTSFHPPGCPSLPESVKFPTFADRLFSASNFCHVLMVVASFRDRGAAPPAVEPGMQGERFQSAQEMALERPRLVDKDPPFMRRFLVALLQAFDQIGRQRHAAVLVVLNSKSNIFLSMNTNGAPCEIDVVPFGEHHFLFSKRRAEEKLVALFFFLETLAVQVSEQGFDLFLGIRLRNLFFNGGHFD